MKCTKFEPPLFNIGKFSTIIDFIKVAEVSAQRIIIEKAILDNWIDVQQLEALCFYLPMYLSFKVFFLGILRVILNIIKK